MFSSSLNTVRLSVVAVRVGRSAAQSIASMQITGALSPIILGETIASNVAMGGLAQMEAVFYVVTRVSLHSPRRLAWLLGLISRFAARCTGCGIGTTGMTALLEKETLLRQVMTVGLKSNAVSALATVAVQIGMQTCYLVKKSIVNPANFTVARKQFCHEAGTIIFSGGASIVGGGCGAVVGGLIMPGIGTALGSLVGSLGGGYVPYAVRGEGPEEELEREERAAALQYNPDRPLKIVEDEDGWVVVMDCENESQFVLYDYIDLADVAAGPLESDGKATVCRAAQSPESETDEDFDAIGADGEPEDDSTPRNFIEFIEGNDLQKRLDEMECGDEEMLLFFVPVLDHGAIGGNAPTAQTSLEEATRLPQGVEPPMNRFTH